MRLGQRLTLTLVAITVILVAPAIYGLFSLYDLRQVAMNLRSRDAVGDERREGDDAGRHDERDRGRDRHRDPRRVLELDDELADLTGDDGGAEVLEALAEPRVDALGAGAVDRADDEHEVAVARVGRVEAGYV